MLLDPSVQNGVRGVRGGEVIRGHLLLEFLDGRVVEEGRVGGPGAAPDDVGRGVVVPGCRFGDDAGRFGGGG